MKSGLTKEELRERSFPLTQTQEGILAECLADPESTGYNVANLFKLSEKVDLKRLTEAIEQAVLNHPYLSVTLAADDDGNWKALRHDEAKPVVETIECGSLPEELITPFSLNSDRLYRIKIYVTGKGNYLLLDFHHIIYDGTGRLILIDDINTAYEGGELKKEKCSGFDIALEEIKLRNTDRLAADRDYYDKLLAEASNVSLPTGDLNTETVTSGRLVRETAIDLDGLSGFCRENGVRRSAFFNAVFAYVLSEYNNSEEALFATIYNGRKDEKLDRTVTMTVKTLPVFGRVSGEDRVTAFIKGIGDQLLNSMSHDLFSFAEICNAHDINSDIMLAYQGDYLDFKTVGGEPVKVCDLLETQAQQPLSVEVNIKGSKIYFNCEYYSNKYSEAFIEGFLGSFEKAVTEFLSREYIRDVSMLNAKAESLVERFNETDCEITLSPCHKLFEEQVRLHPGKTAVTANGESLTYTELNERADKIAGALIKRGLKTDETVGMLLPRSVDAVATEYGIMKAGGAFLPMLPDYPDDRIEYCMSDSGSRFVITTDDMINERTRLSEVSSFKPISLTEIYSEDNTCEIRPEVSPDNMAYCIYTSGSTGKPKGVMIEHRNLCNFVNANEKNDESRKFVTEGKTALSVAALSFDVSVMEIHLSILNGVTVCIATEEEIYDPLKLAALIRENNVEVIAGTPSFLSGLLDIPEFAETLKDIKMYDIGAEAFPPALYDKLRSASPEAVIVNGYGPTEATISCISKVINGDENITIGRPAANVKAWVVDRYLNILPPGAKGELVIGGMGVGRGYMNLPDKTAEAFITLSGMRAYRTGDVVCLNSESELVFFGRKDNQVKLRGLRIELDEIENVMNTYPGLKQSVVLVIEPDRGDPFLCGYFTADKEVDAGELKTHVSGSLARYMVPSAFVQLETFPQTANGKVDKKSLPVPEIRADEIKPAQNEKQQKILELAASVIGHSQFGVATDLYEAGLSSLGAIRLNVLLSKAFDVPMSVRDLKDNPTVEEIDKFISGQVRQETYEILNDYPLTQTQMGILVETLAHPDTVIYNIPNLYKLSDGVDTDRLKQALEDTVRAHPYLNATLFMTQDGEYRAVRKDDTVPLVEIISVQSLPSDLVRPFDLLSEKLYRARIYITEDGNYLYLEFHHIVYDGTSDSVFMEDLSNAYKGLAPKTETYTGYEAALDEEKLRKTDAYDRAKAYYASLLDGADLYMLPDGDMLSADESVIKSAFLDQKSDADVYGIRDFCRKMGVSENAFFNAAFAFVLAKFCGRREALYTTVYNGRSDSRLDRAVTMLVKTFPVLCPLDDDQSIEDFIKAVGRQLSESMTNDLYSFGDIVRDYGIAADVLFVWQGESADHIELCGEKAQVIPLATDEAKAPLQLEVFETGDHYTYHCEYHSNRFSESFIHALTACLDKVVSELLERERLLQLSMLTSEAETLMDELNHTEMPCPKTDIVSMFRQAADKFPDQPAVIFRDEILSYAQVNDISDRIAAYLLDKGVGQGKVVSVLISRSSYMATASLGVLKTGAAYQPLDPSYPQERLNFMVKDAGCALLIADEDLLDRVSEYSGPVLLTKDIPMLSTGTAPEGNPAPDDAFILLYSSGTTGQPKGVILEHHNLVNFCYWYRDYYGLKPGARVAAYASYGFDACMMDMYPALTTGAAVVIIPEEERLDFDAIRARFEKEGVTHSFMTTQVGRQFAEFYPGGDLKHLSVGGEKLTPVYVDKGFSFHNGYGPTECTIFSTVFKVDRSYKRVPIGRPIGNYRCYVADEKLRRLPPFVPGELIVAGSGVGRGYLNRPELTEKAFISNPFCEEEGWTHAYRTGDIVRLLPDGNIDFIGRNDGQVKIRGFRIETTEVEAVIRDFPGVKDATVQAFDNPDGSGKFLAAYVVSEDKDKPVSEQELNEFILSRKPSYMVPAVTVPIDVIPLNQNQKVNKRALPVPTLHSRAQGGRAVEAAPLNVLEQELKGIISGIVGTDDYAITDSLRDLGLTSISAIKLASNIFNRFGVQTGARELVSGGSIQSIENEILKALLAGDAKREEPNENLHADISHEKRCRLSFAQQGVYTECRANPDTVQYNIPFALSFPKGISDKELEEAVRKVVDAHPYILCRFVPDSSGEIIQEPIPDHTLDIPVLEISGDDLETYKKDFVRPFDLEAGPPVRFEIIRSDSLILLADMHHLVSDGASMDIFFEQLCMALDGVEVKEENYTYYDYVAQEEISPETEEFFKNSLSTMEEATQLIPDVFDEGLPHRERSVTVPTDISSVSSHARKLGLTPAAVYLSAVFMTFGRYVCEDTVAIATVSNGRSNLKIGNTMGMFVNTLPLITNLDHDEKTDDYLRRVANDFSDTIAHERYPFARIAAKYDFHPEVSFTYQIGVLNEYRTKAGPVETESLELDIPKLPAAVYIEGTDKAAMIRVDYDSALYSEEMMTGLAKSIENAVHGLISADTLKDISITGEEEWKVLDGFNKPWDLDYDRSDTAVTAFKKNVNKQPDKTAAVFKEKSYTYRQLDELTDRLAAKLYHKACAVTGKSELKEEVVSILVHRNENVFILPLAAIKAGLAYEPLDPSYPKDRLNFMVKDAGACMLLAEEDLAGLIDEYTGEVLTVRELYDMEDGPSLPQGPKPEDLFIMLYTSGSTGTPKGCQIEHRNLTAYAYGVRNDFYTRDDRIAAYASFGFDVNMSDVFCTLINGGTVYLIPEEIRMDLGALAAYFDEAGITALLLTTQVGVQFLQNHPKLKTLRMLVMGGEKLPAVDPLKLSYTIVNGYGPTENCCGVSLFPIKAWEQNIPIGKPMSTIHGYVLDKTGHRLPAGAAGEYCLSGPQVSRGYLNRPDKTKEAYEDCPFNEFRMYHTGDIVRYRPNGDVEFVGRKDGQVKIRGFRIELKEVESAIRDFETVRDVTVQAYDHEGGGKYLAAFVVGDTDIDIDKLREFIKEHKPAYMVPAAIMQIDKIPLTVNQKVDKKALPEPKLQRAAYVAPEGKAEEDFCAIFKSVLGIDRVSAEADFFESGGSSILAMKVVLAAEKAGYSIVYNDVFKYTTPRDLARFVGGEDIEGEAALEGTNAKGAGNTEVPEKGRDGYDYSAIHGLLSGNTVEAFLKGERQPLNDVLLLGGTGYLGSHVLRELILNHDGSLYCFIRPGKDESGEDRLKKTLCTYFGDDFSGLFGSRITVLEGDATDPEALTAFKAPSEGMTVINCAASVKHFAKGDEIERMNVGSVKNLTAWCKENGARLIHISTGSVAGDRKDGMPPEGYRFTERRLYMGQEIDGNQYVHSKFMAERHIYEEILEHGLNAKVLRVGNLAPREEDGQFQINFRTNNYMNSLRAMATLGVIDYGSLNEQTEFSPIDRVAEAVLALAATPKECVCFIAMNPHRPLMSDVIREMNALGLSVRGAEGEEFIHILQGALADNKKSEAVSCLIAYDSKDDVKMIGLESIDHDYTVSILERLGFFWPETGSEYIRRFLEKLMQKGFF